MGILNEIGEDFMKMVATLGVLLACVFLFVMYTYSIWLVVLFIIIGAAAWFGGRYVFLGHF